MKHFKSCILIIASAFLLAFTPPLGRNDKKYYNEVFRPQFHFTPEKGILGEPTALVYYDGEYHLFYQYKPDTTTTEFMQWGHAVSQDLVLWKHLPGFNILDEKARNDGYGTPASGCSIVDDKNLTGLQEGSEKTLLIFYTSRECGQCLVFSNDKGRTWKKYSKNPLIPYENDGANCPYVFYYPPSGKWCMTLYRRPDNTEAKQGISIYNSDDLIHWKLQSHTEGFSEGAELYSLPLDGKESEKKWIMAGLTGGYMIGKFDGKLFTPETGVKRMDYGKNFYAARTWSNAPEGKLIQIAWMKGAKYPKMPFDGQMTFPRELSLKTVNTLTVICSKPVEGIAELYDKEYKKKEKNIIPGLKGNPIGGNDGDVIDIKGKFDLKTSDSFGFIIRNGEKGTGVLLKYTPARKVLDCLGRQVTVEPENGKIDLRILVDRSSIEVYANNGEAVLSNCFEPDPKDDKLVLWTSGGELFVDEIEIYRLKSAWPEK